MIHLRSVDRMIGLLLLSLALVVGCNGDSTRRGEIRGHVTLDGKPIEQGSIMFTPIDGTKGTVTGGEIKDGEYRLTVAKGPGVGWNRVEIHSTRNTGRMIPKGLGGTGQMVEEMVEAVAPQFNRQSTLKTEVKAGDNEANFEVTSQ